GLMHSAAMLHGVSFCCARRELNRTNCQRARSDDQPKIVSESRRLNRIPKIFSKPRCVMLPRRAHGPSFRAVLGEESCLKSEAGSLACTTLFKPRAVPIRAGFAGR